MIKCCYQRSLREMQGFVRIRRQRMCFVARFALLGVTAMLLSPVSAQVAEGICACTPRVYQMTVNLVQTCEATGNFGPGVFLTDCSVFPLNNEEEVTDLVPQEIVTVDIVELGQNLATPVGQLRLEGSYGTGDIFEYMSNTAVPEDLNDLNVPKALQITLTGNNANRDIIVVNALIAFTNECDQYPILLDGAGTGWINLTEAQAPDPSVCPAATMTNAPVGSSTSAPTLSATPSSPPPAPTTPTTILPSSQLSTMSPSTGMPGNLEPGTNPPTPHSTKSPKPRPPLCDCSKGKGKGKGNSSSKMSSKSGSKSAKSSKSSKSKSKSSKESHESNDYLDIFNNIFRDRYYQTDDCDCSSVSSGSSQGSGKGKGKGKGYYNDYRTPSPTVHSVERTAAPSIVPPEHTLLPTSSASPTIINATVVPTTFEPSEAPSDAPSTPPSASPVGTAPTPAPSSAASQEPTQPPGDDGLPEAPPADTRSAETTDTVSGGLLTAFVVGGSIMTVTLFGLLGWNYWENQRERQQQGLTGTKIEVRLPTIGNIDDNGGSSESETSNLTMASQK